MSSVMHSNHAPLKNGGMICFLFLALSACTSPSVFDRNVEIEHQSWSNNNSKEFSVPISDTLNSYTLYVNTRHSLQYPFSDLALSIQVSHPGQQEKTYHLTLQLAESDGRWKGNGTGNIFQNQVLFLKNHHFTDTGLYTFKVKPIMTQNPLPGIVNIGLRVDKKL